MATHKSQHFVPQCYTKAWHDPASLGDPKITPYVWRFERDGSGAKRRAPVNLFAENDIYTVRMPDGGRDLHLEHGFQQLEDQFARVRERTLEPRGGISSDDFVNLLVFTATAQARTASHRDFHREQWTGMLEKMEDMQRAFDAASPEKKEAMARSSHSPIGVSPGKGIGIDEVKKMVEHPIQQMIGPTVEAVLPIMIRMNLAILCSDDPVGFVTTDTPVTWFDPQAHKLPPMYRNPGIAVRTIEVTLPISPRQCLVLTHNPALQGYNDVDAACVDEMNRRHIAHCSGQFISNSSETRPAWFAERPMPEDSWEKERERKIASGELKPPPARR